MSESTLQKLVGLARRAVRDLGGEATDAQLELWATDVHESMSAGGRSFHDVGHVFDVAEGGNAVQVLAALFHDTVYMQVDGGLPSRLVDVLGDAFHVGSDGVALVIGDDPWKARLAQIFGFVDGQVLSPFAGLNELLSALFAVRRLHDVLPVDATVRVAVCIEATIPFRSAPGEGVSDALLARVEGLGLALDAVQAVKDAVGLANQDVANFAFADTARFLDNTWQLLPESNTQLRVRVYTIDQYHLAMKKMRGFFGFLKAEVVFRGFRGAPSPARLDALRAAAARNIELAHHYLTAKLLAASLLQAIAGETGGDAPVSLFMGDLPSVSSTSPRLEHHLPEAVPVASADREVLRLLVEGRASEGDFDLRNAPLAGFLYATCGADVHEHVARYEADGARALLAGLPPGVLRPVLEGCARLAVTRTDRVLGLLDGAA